jgi:hypothetical protein
LCITRDLTIRAAAGEAVVLDGGNKERVLWIKKSVTVSLHGLRVTNGLATGQFGGYGGGIRNDGTPTITDCLVDHNTAYSVS